MRAGPRRVSTHSRRTSRSRGPALGHPRARSAPPASAPRAHTAAARSGAAECSVAGHAADARHSIGTPATVWQPRATTSASARARGAGAPEEAPGARARTWREDAGGGGGGAGGGGGEPHIGDWEKGSAGGRFVATGVAPRGEL